MICNLGADGDAPNNRASDGRTGVAARESRMHREMTKTGAGGSAAERRCTGTIGRLSGIVRDYVVQVSDVDRSVDHHSM